jgi:MFS superfamily sulfate permease-like transporter
MKTLTLKLMVPLLMAVVLPPPALLAWLGFTMLVDLITGVAVAIKKDIPRTSTGFRKTVNKFLQYGGAIAVGIILANISDMQKDSAGEKIYQYFSNSMLSFIIFIEIKSIMENLVQISPKSDFTKLFLNPIHKILSLDLKNFLNTKTENEKS